jgi:hypothetical protein
MSQITVTPTSSDAPRRRTRKPYVIAALAVVAVLAAIVLVWFQPQKLVFDDRVDEDLPGVVAAAERPSASPAPAAPVTGEEPSPPTTAPPLPPNSLAGGSATAARLGSPVAVSTGAFVSLDHPTSGTALVVIQPDGSRVLRFEALDTDNGPDLRVVLSTAAPGAGDYDELVELGRLKGNVGSQNYEIPADIDLTSIRSVVIWCERFSSPFGEAPITAVG